MRDSSTMMQDEDDGRSFNLWGECIASTDSPLPFEVPSRHRLASPPMTLSATLAPPFESVLGSTDTVLRNMKTMLGETFRVFFKNLIPIQRAFFKESLVQAFVKKLMPFGRLHRFETNELDDDLLGSMMGDQQQVPFISRDLPTPPPFQPEAASTKRAPAQNNEVGGVDTLPTFQHQSQKVLKMKNPPMQTSILPLFVLVTDSPSLKRTPPSLLLKTFYRPTFFAGESIEAPNTTEMWNT